MSPKKKKGKKERLKPLSFYGHDPKDVIRAFMQIDPQELKKLEDIERDRYNLNQTSEESSNE